LRLFVINHIAVSFNPNSLIAGCVVGVLLQTSNSKSKPQQQQHCEGADSALALAIPLLLLLLLLAASPLPFTRFSEYQRQGLEETRD